MLLCMLDLDEVVALESEELVSDCEDVIESVSMELVPSRNTVVTVALLEKLVIMLEDKRLDSTLLKLDWTDDEAFNGNSDELVKGE